MDVNRLSTGCRRAESRTGLKGRATLTLPGALVREAQMADVGAAGLSLLTTRPVAPGTRCTVEFELPIDQANERVAVQAKSVYSSYTGPDSFKVGFAFTAVEAHARRLIERFLAG